MGKCKITNAEFIYNGMHTVCRREGGDEVLTCFISPHRWDRSSCPHKHEYREKYKVYEYANEKFADIDEMLKKFQRSVPHGYTVTIKHDSETTR